MILNNNIFIHQLSIFMMLYFSPKLKSKSMYAIIFAFWQYQYSNVRVCFGFVI